MRDKATEKVHFHLMMAALDPRDYPSRQAMRQHARELLKEVKHRHRSVFTGYITKLPSRAERDASKTIKES